jgi:hypothetical protein
MSDNKLNITMSGKVVASIWIDKIEETYKFEYSDELECL